MLITFGTCIVCHTMVAIADLYAEAVEVSNAATAFEDHREFDVMTQFIEKIQKAQGMLLDHILEEIEKPVVEAASSGAKSAVVFTFKGSDMFEGHSILFMLLGGTEDDKYCLVQYDFEPLLQRLKNAVKPFGIRHVWEKATNDNFIVLYWE